MSKEIDKEKAMQEAMETIGATTSIIFTPDEFSEGNFLMYSEGMKDNYNLPDLEVRGVPGMFSKSCAGLINELNAYRIVQDKPLLVRQTIGWNTGDILVEESKVYDDMLLLVSRLTDIECCHGCDCKKHGVSE